MTAKFQLTMACIMRGAALTTDHVEVADWFLLFGAWVIVDRCHVVVAYDSFDFVWVHLNT